MSDTIKSLLGECTIDGDNVTMSLDTLAGFVAHGMAHGKAWRDPERAEAEPAMDAAAREARREGMFPNFSRLGRGGGETPTPTAAESARIGRMNRLQRQALIMAADRDRTGQFPNANRLHEGG